MCLNLIQCMCVYVWYEARGLLKIIGLFCRKYSFLQGSFAKETYIFSDFLSKGRTATHNNIQSHLLKQFTFGNIPLRLLKTCVGMSLDARVYMCGTKNAFE